MTAVAPASVCAHCGEPTYGTACDAQGRCDFCQHTAAYEAKVAALTDKRGQYQVTLASIGNPDFRQDSRRSLPGVPKRKVRVATLRAASEICRLYIEHYDLGGGNWCGGLVVDAKSKAPIAQVSYNGRTWKPGPYPQPEISIA